MFLLQEYHPRKYYNGTMLNYTVVKLYVFMNEKNLISLSLNFRMKIIRNILKVRYILVRQHLCNHKAHASILLVVTACLLPAASCDH